MKLAVAVGVFGFVCCLSLYQGVHEARAYLKAIPALAHYGPPVTELPIVEIGPPEDIPQEDEPLAVRNRNPLNVKARKTDPWKGQVGVDKFGHAVFESYEYGVRAAALTLRAYARRHKITTVQEMVERFAEGNHAGYIAHVCKVLKVKPKEEIDLVKRMPELLRVMARHESGKTLPEALFIPYDVVAKL